MHALTHVTARARGLLLIVLASHGITSAAPPDTKPPQILLQTKVVEVPTNGPALPAPLAATDKEPGLRGTLADRDYQLFIRELAQRRGVDLASAPNVTVKDGQHAKVEIMRAIPYKDEEGKPASKNCGFSLSVLAKAKGGDQLDLDLSPQFVELDGVSKLKAPVTATMTSGQTVILEIHSKTDGQLVMEENAAGEIIKSETQLTTRRRFVFITGYLIDSKTGKVRIPKP